MLYRTIREWESIEIGKGERHIPDGYAKCIQKTAGASDLAGKSGNGVLKLDQRKLTARGVVGLVSVPGCQLEILPKIHYAGDDSNTNAQDNILKQKLIEMLYIANEFPAIGKELATVGSSKHNSFLEILVRAFCIITSDAIRQGVARGYQTREGDLEILRGRLNLIRQFTNLAALPNKVACEYDTLTHDIALNRIIRYAITQLQRVSREITNQKELRRIRSIYSDIGGISSANANRHYVVFDRSNYHWRRSYLFAKFFLSGYHQGTSYGKNDGCSLLFKMSKVFEKYVARIVADSVSRVEYKVTYEGTQRTCLFEGNKPVSHVRPDIVVERQSDGDVLVIDTKWKKIYSKGNEQIQQIRPSDVHQMIAYQNVYGCSTVAILYPHHGELSDKPLISSYKIANSRSDRNLVVATLNLTTSIADQKECLKRLIEFGMSR